MGPWHQQIALFLDKPNSIQVSSQSGWDTEKGKTVEKDLLKAVPGKYGTILIDPPWRFANRTGKMAPEHRRLHRYPTMSFEEIAALPVGEVAAEKSHLYLWCPNALVAEALSIMKRWGFTYKTNIVWYKVRKDGGPDGRGVGFYFRNVTELVLFGIKGHIRTLAPGRSQVNVIVTRKEEHSKKPDQLYDIIQRCSPDPYCELFSRRRVPGWTQWGDEVDTYQPPPYRAYARSTNGDRSTASALQIEATGTRPRPFRLPLE
jgi:N6-adenosine-specific RNA methylase IME4